MRYAPKGFCLNDFELLKDGDLYHLIHLQGPPVMPFDAAKLETSYGHAVSKDLISWETQAPVFGISDYPHFDDSAVWTMNIIRHAGKLWMFYTGLTQEPRFLQQVGLAVSESEKLTDFKRYSEKPIVSASEKHYRTTGFMAWRDPFVVFDDEDNNWVMYICAKTVTGEEHKQGCIGCAVSDNLTEWTVREPVLSPGTFGEMECPVIFRHDRYWYMLVSVGDDRKIHAYRSEHAKGPFDYLGPIAPAYNYAPRVITAPNSEPVLFHTVPRKWQAKDDGEYMRGKLAQPKTLKFTEQGIPYLGWYQPSEQYYQPASDAPSGNFLMIAGLPPDFSYFTIKMRTQSEGNPSGVELVYGENRLTLRYIEDGYELAAKLYTGPIRVKEIIVLAHDEFYEVYFDDILEMTALGYRHLTGNAGMSVDGSEQGFQVLSYKE